MFLKTPSKDGGASEPQTRCTVEWRMQVGARAELLGALGWGWCCLQRSSHSLYHFTRSGFVPFIVTKWEHFWMSVTKAVAGTVLEAGGAGGGGWRGSVAFMGMCREEFWIAWPSVGRLKWPQGWNHPGNVNISSLCSKFSAFCCQACNNDNNKNNN